jgi:hypothetical protein
VDRAAAELCLHHSEKIVDAQVDWMDLLLLDVPEQPVQLGQALLIRRSSPPERHVPRNLAGGGSHESELADCISAGRAGRDAGESTGNARQEQPA